MLTVIATPKAISAQADKPVEQPGRQLVGHGLHEIGGSDDGALGAVEDGENVWPLFRCGWMEPIPTLDRERVAAQFVVAGNAPDIGGNAKAVGKNFLGAQRLVQNRAT